jgi:hypothetical protein
MVLFKHILFAVGLTILTGSANAWADDENFEQFMYHATIENFKAAEMLWNRLAGAGCEEAAIYRDSLTIEIAKLQHAEAKKISLDAVSQMEIP